MESGQFNAMIYTSLSPAAVRRGNLCRFASRAVRKSRHDENSGFTLLELLVVIAILGIVAGLVTLSTAPAEQRRVAEEVDRLAALFRLAQDEARISGRRIIWQADARGYRFLTPEGVRGAQSADDPLRPREWPFSVRFIDAPEVLFGREPLMTPARVHLVTADGELTLELDEFGELRVPN